MVKGQGMSGIVDTAMAIAVVAAFLLAAAGIKLALGRETRSRGILMIVAAAVLLTNVMIWTV